MEKLHALVAPWWVDIIIVARYQGHDSIHLRTWLSVSVRQMKTGEKVFEFQFEFDEVKFCSLPECCKDYKIKHKAVMAYGNIVAIVPLWIKSEQHQFSIGFEFRWQKWVVSRPIMQSFDELQWLETTRRSRDAIVMFRIVHIPWPISCCAFVLIWISVMTGSPYFW